MNKRCSVLVVLSAMLLLLLVGQAGAGTYEGLVFGRWPDLQMTYQIDASCSNQEWKNEYFMVPIRDGIAAWSQWLQGYVNFTEAASNPRLIFQCFESNRTPSGNMHDLSYGINGTGYFLVPAYIRLSTWPPAITTWGVEHELGHVLGLSGGDGIMIDSPTYLDIARNATPTQQQLDEIRNTYETLPIPEFPTPIIALVIAFGAIIVIQRTQKHHHDDTNRKSTKTLYLLAEQFKSE